MYYPAVFVFDGECYQIYVPDVAGATAISEGDNLDAAIKTIEEMLTIALENKAVKDYPAASNIQHIQKNELIDEGAFVMPVRAMPSKGKNVRVTLSMPDYVLNIIDNDAKKAGVSRSAHVINAVLG